MRINTKRVLSTALAVVAALAFTAGLGCKKAPPVDEAKILARVGDQVLTTEDLERMDSEQRRVKVPSYLSRQELMEEWVRSEILYQHCLKEKVDKEKECAWRLRNVDKGVVISRFWELNVYDKFPNATDADALAWYEANKDKMFRAREPVVALRRIMVYKKADAEAILARLKAGEDFKAVASKDSVTPEKLEGGAQGYRPLRSVSADYRDAVAKMKVGEVAGPIPLGSYFVIIKLEDRVDAGGYLKPDIIGMPVLKDRAKVATWEKEAERLGKSFEAAAKVERHPERIPEGAVEMLPDKTKTLTGGQPQPKTTK